MTSVSCPYMHVYTLKQFVVQISNSGRKMKGKGLMVSTLIITNLIPEAVIGSLITHSSC